MDCRIKSGNDAVFVEAPTLNLQSAYDLRAATEAIGREVAMLPINAARRRARG
jgi:hypothetical protein